MPAAYQIKNQSTPQSFTFKVVWIEMFANDILHYAKEENCFTTQSQADT